MNETKEWTGVFTALVTPMSATGAVDWQLYERLVERQIAAGIRGLVPVGTTGESPTLNVDEHLKVIERTVKIAAGRVPVIAGTGANSTTEALELTGAADRLGADGFLQVAPYYNKPSQEGLFQHFKAIADATSKPIMLYSIPSRCGVAIETDTVARLADNCDNIRHIKEAGGQVEKVVALRNACPEVTVFSGDDGLINAFCKAGAGGVVSVATNIAPAIIVEFFNACTARNSVRASEMTAKYERLLGELVFLDGNPVTVKEAMFQAGLLPSPTVRLPLVRTSEANQRRLRESLRDIGLM